MSIYDQIKESKKQKPRKKNFGTYIDADLVSDIYATAKILGISANKMVGEILAGGIDQLKKEMASNGHDSD